MQGWKPESEYDPAGQASAEGEAHLEIENTGTLYTVSKSFKFTMVTLSHITLQFSIGNHSYTLLSENG